MCASGSSSAAATVVVCECQAKHSVGGAQLHSMSHMTQQLICFLVPRWSPPMRQGQALSLNQIMSTAGAAGVSNFCCPALHHQRGVTTPPPPDLQRCVPAVKHLCHSCRLRLRHGR